MTSVPGGRRDLAFTCLLPICAADSPEFLVEACDSLAAQTLAPAAVLFCEDGALPLQLEMVAEAQARRLGAKRLRHDGPPGLAANLNAALPAVATPWIARADADDINEPGRFAAQVRHLAEHPELSALGGAIREFWPDGAERLKTMPLAHDAIVRWAARRNPLNHMTAFVRAADLRAVGGYPLLPRSQDYGLWLSMIAAGHRLANLPQPLVRARLGWDFHRRRTGAVALAAEWRLHRLRRALPDLSAAEAWAVLALRWAALAHPGVARRIYARWLRP